MKNKRTKIQTASNAQQGDVLLRKLDKLPDGQMNMLSTGRCVLAHGESGHSHVVDDEEAELIQIGERMLLRLGNPATVTHEEHKPIKLSPGIWEIGIVREFDYFSRMARSVQD